MSYHVEFLSDALTDLKELDGAQRPQILAAIRKVSENPLPKSEGGMGQPIGNKHSNNLTGFCKIKLLKLGIRVVYQIIRTNGVMKIIVIAARADNEAYELAAKRMERKK